MEYSKKHRKALQEIVSICYQMKTDLGHDAFFDFSPHCNLICVRVFEGGWDGVKTEDWRGECYLDWTDADQKLESIINCLWSYFDL